jgi:AcrR family transcriptional regulator
MDDRPSEVRESLLRATVKLFAEGGASNSSTRRIAREAGVNEVTLFRHFGTKEELLRSAMRWFADKNQVDPLPTTPRDPASELIDWCRDHHRRLYVLRALIRTCLADHSEHPDRNSPTLKLPLRVNQELHEYLLRLRSTGLASGNWNAQSAANLLIGALLSDALGRDAMPEQFPGNVNDDIAQYVHLLLRAIGSELPESAGNP